MPSEVVELGMDDHVPDEIDDAKYEQLSNHVVKKGNLEFIICKQVANHGGDELVDKGRPLKRKKLEIKWYIYQLYEMHLLLNPSEREQLENELTSREELAVLQVEFADREGQMQQLMKELKKSQNNVFFWKLTVIVFRVVASLMFVRN
ncbi:hypothetical protein Tco_0883841 [Tanacetum coccineum]